MAFGPQRPLRDFVAPRPAAAARPADSETTTPSRRRASQTAPWAASAGAAHCLDRICPRSPQPSPAPDRSRSPASAPRRRVLGARRRRCGRRGCVSRQVSPPCRLGRGERRSCAGRSCQAIPDPLRGTTASIGIAGQHRPAGFSSRSRSGGAGLRRLPARQPQPEDQARARARLPSSATHPALPRPRAIYVSAKPPSAGHPIDTDDPQSAGVGATETSRENGGKKVLGIGRFPAALSRTHVFA